METAPLLSYYQHFRTNPNFSNLMRNPNIQGQIWLVFILHFYSPGYQFILVCGIHFQLNHPLWTRATNRAGAGECQLDTSCALQLQSSCGNFKVWFTVIRIRDCLPSTWHLYLISALLHCKYLDIFWRKKKIDPIATLSGTKGAWIQLLAVGARSSKSEPPQPNRQHHPSAPCGFKFTGYFSSK